MSLLQFFAGNGNRRKTDEQWTKLQQQLSTTQRELAAAKRLIAELTEQRDQARRNDIRHHHLWQSADREVRRLGFLLGADAELPATKVPAPVDNGCRDTPRANAETQPVDVRDLRAAMGEAATVTLPAVTTVVATPVVMHTNEPMTVTWGTGLPAKTEAALEDWATGTAPGPLSSATSVPRGVGDKASVKVQLAISEGAVS